MRRWTLVALLVLGCRQSEPPKPAVLLVTPEVAADGLATHLVDAFQRQTSRHLDVRIVPIEHIAEHAGAKSGAAVLHTHPSLAIETRLRDVFATHDFYILGPRNDPAHVGDAASVPAALAKIVAQNRTYCSPDGADRDIWSAARINPRDNRRFRICSGNAAARLHAYTIADRTEDSKLTILMREKPLLHTDYVVALLPSRRPLANTDAEWFVKWLMSFRGREAVLAFKQLQVPGQHESM